MTKLYRRGQGQDTLLPRMMEVEMKLVREMMTGEPYLMRPKRKKHEKNRLKTSTEVGALGEKLDGIVRTRRWRRR